ncbi:MAG TPA: HD domain-containing protein, partial [Planctomycetota bacterium]|nr:HD domain-containing protein [Planctomycetota bacterium]
MTEGFAPRRLVAGLFGTLKLMQLYGRRHVATTGAVCGLQEAVRQAAAEDGEARVGARGRRLLVNGETMRGRECGTLALGYLASEWSKRGIEQVRFQKEVMTEELEAFVAAFLDVDVTRPEPADRLAATLANESVGGVIVEKLAADDREPVLLEERRESVMRAYLRGLRAFKEVLRCDGLRDRAKLRRARRAVQGVVDSFLEDESAVLALAQIRSFDVKLFHHSLNACVLAILIGQRLRLPRRQLADLGLAALFHDVGKTAPGGGTAEEEERAHPARGARMLLEEGTTHEGMLKAAIAAYEHHAGADRSGFPRIPHDPHLVSRIVAIADAYDSLTAPPAPLAPPDALARMLARKDLDPLLVKVFVGAIGIYPVGSVVELTTGETAVVQAAPAPETLDRPRVKVVKRGAGALDPDALVEVGGDGPRIAR